MKPLSKKIQYECVLWGQMVLGLLLCTAAYRMFLIPNELAPGGFTGAAQLINSATGWPVGWLTLLMNVPLFLFSMKRLGLSFAVRSVAATVGLSLMIDYLPIRPVLPDAYAERMILSAVFGGVLGGMGFGFIIRGNATTGGSDMLAKLICRRFPFLSIGAVMLAFDGVVILASAFVFDVTSAMFALICAALMSYVLDLVVVGMNSARAYFVVTDKGAQIAGRVMKELERGVTEMPGRGMYSGQDKSVLLCVVNRVEGILLRRIVAEEDPGAFMVDAKVHEALGEGFHPHYTGKK